MVSDDDLFKALSDRMRELSVTRGMEIAQKFFAKRRGSVEAHVSRVELSGLLAIAFEQGMIEGVASQPPLAPPLSQALAEYFSKHGIVHEDPECPEDDTCSCPIVQAISRGLRT